MKNIIIIVFLIIPYLSAQQEKKNISDLESQKIQLEILRSKTDAAINELGSSVKGILGFTAIDLTTGEKFSINENLIFPQGSSIKIPVMMEIFKQASEGKFSLDDKLPVTDKHKVAGSGIIQHFGKATSEIGIRDLCVLMIVLSDNTATNMLIDLAGMENINATMISLGFQNTKVQRRMIDQKSSAKGNENLSTPYESAKIMETLYKGEFLNRELCDDIISILKLTRGGVVASGLPENIPVAFKPGGIAGVVVEWCIVDFKDRPYVITFMENYGVDMDVRNVMKDISKVVFDYFRRLAQSSKYGTYVPVELLEK